MNESIHCALSSRVRLARNIRDIPFRTKMNAAQADACVDQVLNALKDDPQSYRYYPMRGMSLVKRVRMVEAHQISRDLFKTDDLGAALIRRDGAVVIMLNEEDHLRIQGFSSGLQLETAAQNAFQTEESVGKKIHFSFDEEWGYLTACPTNTGTGMRASVMLHLPMLTLTKQMGMLNQSASKMGLTIRGFYGEGSQFLGNIFQLSNQVTLGRTEEEIIDSVNAFALQIERMENDCLRQFMKQDALSLEDQMYRSIALLKAARKMTMKEFFIHWSNFRLYTALYGTMEQLASCEEMLRNAQRAHLQDQAEHELSDKEIDIARAALIREAMKNY